MEKYKLIAESADVEFLQWKIGIYIQKEEYEKAAILKKWLDEIISRLQSDNSQN